MIKNIVKSQKLENVCYDIRGPVLEEAKRLEEQGNQILKLNIGNPYPFGLETDDIILRQIIHHLSDSQGYSDSKGIDSARLSILQYYQNQGIEKIDIEDIYLGNGVSELIVVAMQALLNNGDELLVPAPDYPLWTAAVSLSGGKAVHYLCDEQSQWYPDPDDIRKKINNRTRGIVLINPNNPTGAVYSKEILEEIIQIARENDLIIFSDEIYDKILYDGAKHTTLATLVDDLLCVTFNGLSKTYRLAGLRGGWMMVSGAKDKARDYIEGLNILTSMRLCANVPAQFAIQASLGGPQSIYGLTQKGGRLYEQMDLAYKKVNEIEGLSCVRPKGAMYLFPKMDIKKFKISDDEGMILELLKDEHILLVHGRAFNWPEPDHFRIVFLPEKGQLELALEKMATFFNKKSL
jgi:alanine-synthesizing transaminase